MVSEIPENSKQPPTVIWFDDEVEPFRQIGGKLDDARVILCETDHELLYRVQEERSLPTLLCTLYRHVSDKPLADVFRSGSIRGVVSDLNIGGDALAGLKILALAAASPERPDLALYSSSSDPSTQELAKAIGAKHLLSKRRPAELTTLLREWLRLPGPDASEKVQELTARLRLVDRNHQIELDGVRRRVQRLARERGALKKELEAVKAKKGARAPPTGLSKELIEKSARLQKLERVVQVVLAHNHDLSNTSSLTVKTLEHLCVDTKLVPPVLLADLQRARIAAKHCDILVQSLASISGNEKHAAVKSAPSRLETAVTEVCEILRRKVPDAIRVKTEIPSKLPLCSIPMHLLMRVLMNVLLNSLEAMPKGGTILIKASFPRAKERRTRLEIRDSGVGIRKLDLSKVSNPDFSTKGKRQGFGLFIVQSVLTDYKGKMAVRSVRGKGTTVILELPSI